MKRCSSCNNSLPIESFRKTSKRYTQPYCKECEKRIRREQYRNNLDSNREKGRDKALKRAYGITREEFSIILETQNTSCASCGIKEPGGRGNWHVDHNHNTGKIRGLLCHRCNTGLGLFLESETILKEAIKYLRKHNDIE